MGSSTCFEFTCLYMLILLNMELYELIGIYWVIFVPCKSVTPDDPFVCPCLKNHPL